MASIPTMKVFSKIDREPRIINQSDFNEELYSKTELSTQEDSVEEDSVEEDSVEEDSIQVDVSEYHQGGGYYLLPNGTKIRGKANAIAALNL